MKQRTKSGYASLADVLDRILDKSMVVEPCQRVRLMGIDVLRRKAHPAVTSIQTYQRYEEVVKAKRLQSGSLTSELTSRLRSANFFDLLDRIFDKGITVDSWHTGQFFGIDMLQIETRVIVTSLQTYLLHGDIDRHRSAFAHHAGR